MVAPLLLTCSFGKAELHLALNWVAVQFAMLHDFSQPNPCHLAFESVADYQ